MTVKDRQTRLNVGISFQKDKIKQNFRTTKLQPLHLSTLLDICYIFVPEYVCVSAVDYGIVGLPRG